MKKSRNILLGLYIINFIVLLIVFINSFGKEINPKIYLGVYFWIINLIEIILFSANLKKICNKNKIIIITLIFCVQIVLLLFVPAYSQFEPQKDNNDKTIQITPAVMPNYYNAYGIKLYY